MSGGPGARPDTWMPLYIGDYLADTMRLNHAQHGIYLLLIMAYWRNGGPLLDDAGELAATAKCSGPEWRKNLPVISRFFHIAGGLWSHKRIDAELAGATRRTEERSKAGSEGARKRWQTDGKAMAEPLANASQNDASLPSPSPEESKKKDTQVGVQKGCRLPIDFVMPEVWNEEGWKARETANLPPIDLATESVKFCNHWWSKAGRDGTKSDWKKTWINWCLNARGVSNGRYDRHAADEAGHARALAILRDAAIERDDGPGSRGPAQTPH